MTEFSEKSRAAQIKELPEGPLRDNVLALYDQIEALSTDQRSLMIALVLQSVEQGLRHLRDEVEVTPAANATLMVLGGIVAAAEYGISLEREAAGFTSTGDGKVTDVFETTQNVVRETVGANIPPEKRAKIEAVTRRIQERIKAGDDPETVVREEAEGSGIDFEVILEPKGHNHDESREVAGSHQAGGQPSAQRTYKDEHNLHTGQYL
jgi:hypothetical protein